MESSIATHTPVVQAYSAPLTASTPAVAAKRSRIDSVDLLRGLVMVIMLLDHTRDFVHNQALQFDPTDLTRTYPILFFTRWVTHFCAPIFVFLAGTGSYFQIARGKSKADLSRFLVTRGFWLIFLEFTVVRIALSWEFNLAFLGMMQVIWALGWSMIVLAALIRLPLRAIAWFGIAMIALHNVLDLVSIRQWQGPGTPIPGALGKLWMVLHQPGTFPIADWPSPTIFILYPLIPWIGVMAAGYAFGRVYDWPAEERRAKLMRWGIAITLGFLLLRLADLYGDPIGWSVQKTVGMTVVSFFNTQKYPPSLLYLMMTLGPALIALSLWDGYNISSAPNAARRNPISNALITFGRVPLFFYLLQWPTAHGAGYLLTLATHKATWIFFRPPLPGPTPPPDAGFDLWVVYVAWICGALLLYPICRWYAAVKARRRDWWLSYL
ncbi:MAG: heparan-alpha-glucosaminide N-acetyltransferase domain-containing protein [Gemmatimonadales bacterium]